MKLIQPYTFQPINRPHLKSTSFSGFKQFNKLDRDTLIINPKEIVPLHRNSIYANFFGVDSQNSIEQKLMNHLILAIEKEKEGFFINCEKNYEVDKNVDSTTSLHNFLVNNQEFIKKLKQNGAARFSLNSNLFSEDNKMGIHTLGLVFDNETDTLFVLDSINDSSLNVPTYKKYKTILNELFLNQNIKGEFSKIIFSTKPQQKDGEYTCNNWAIANIEAVKKELKKGKKITTTDGLNNILPNNINKVLKNQYEYVLKRKDNYTTLF